jgi:hypothetical protein
MASFVFIISYFFVLAFIGIITQIWCWKINWLYAVNNAILNLIYYFKEGIYWIGDIKFQKRLINCCISNGNAFDKFNLVSIISVYLTPLVVLTLICCLFLYSILFWIVWSCLAVIWIVFIVIFGTLTKRYYKKSEIYINGFQNGKFLLNKPHHGVVFVQYSNPDKGLFIADCIDLLVKNFKEQIPVKVYPIKNETDFKQVYANPNIQWLWIIGHGAKGHLDYMENTKVNHIEYRNYQKNPNLLFIAQLHCNPGTGPSLPEINGLIPDYDMTKFRFAFQNRCYIKNKTKEFIDNQSHSTPESR